MPKRTGRKMVTEVLTSSMSDISLVLRVKLFAARMSCKVAGKEYQRFYVPVGSQARRLVDEPDDVPDNNADCSPLDEGGVNNDNKA